MEELRLERAARTKAEEALALKDAADSSPLKKKAPAVINPDHIPEKFRGWERFFFFI